ncbi:MAG: undecaprenyl-phosphate galactose phosphotransferase WbaP [bacterium]|nr:undecaprenyl-phosphate galactose phosphotransferase WbaP [bacterium]
MGYRKSWVIGGILMISDAVILYGVFRLAALLRNAFTPLIDGNLIWQTVAPLVQLGILFGIVVFMIEGLYPGYGMTAVKELGRMSKSVTLVFFFLAVVSYLNKPFQDISRAFLLFSWFLALVLLPLGHFILRNIISRFSWYGTPVVVFGDGAYAQQIVGSLKRMRRLGWQPTTVLPVNAIKRGRMDTQMEIAIFAPSPGLSVANYARILNSNFRKVILVRQKDNLGSVWVEPRDLDGQLGLEFHYNLFNRFARLTKRLMDVGISLALSIMLLPLLGILCLLIFFDSPGRIFFHQERLGRGFKRFNIIKFRTMAVNAEQRLSKLLQKDSAARAEYKKYHKLTNDPRITRVGKWLRRFSLDELPQLLNVLKGDMSVIGPRAYLPSELNKMGSYAPIILRIQPGLTGWWQVMGRHKTTFEQRLRMDDYYVSNWSLWMDFYILLKTVWVVLSGKGA